MRILFLLFPFFACSVLAQTPPYYHYTTSDGLASNTVLDLMQDSQGYIWMATNNGLSRFDGKRFVNYGIPEGLNSTTIVSLVEGKDGEIFIGNYEKGINVIKDGKITSYTHTDSKQEYIREIFFDNNKLLIFTSGTCLVEYSENFYKFVTDTAALKNADGSFIIFNSVIKNKQGNFLAMTSSGIYKLEEKKFVKLPVSGLGNSQVYNACEDNEGNLFVGGNGIIYIIKKNTVIKTIKSDSPNDIIYKIFIDSKDNIWFSIINKGFRVIFKGTENIFDVSNKLKIPKGAIDKFIEDKEGNIWINTFGKGVFCLNNLYITNYNEDDGLSNNNVQAFVKDGFGRIVIGTFNGINIFENERFDILKFGGNVTDYVYEMQYINNRIYTCVTSHSSGSNKKIFDKNEFWFLTGASFCLNRDGNYMLGEWGNYYLQSTDVSKLSEEYSGKSNLVYGDDLINNRINKIFEDSEGNLWFGTNLGLCKMKNGEKTYFKDYEILNSTIKAIIQDKNKKIWFAGEKGIASYNLNNNSIKEYRNIGGFSLSASNTLAFDNNNRLWVGSMKGVYIIENDSIKFLNETSGLPSNEIFSLFYDEKKNEMYIGTSFGFSILDIEKFDDHKSLLLKVKIISISAGENVYYEFNELNFEREDNYVYINFTALNYSSPASTVYEYNINDKSEITENDFINLASLEHGDYNVEIRAKTLNGAWSEPAHLFFTIKPKIRETKWFPFALAGVIVVWISFFIYTRVKNYRLQTQQKLEITNQINQLKHQAVSALMNPHFIYNALSSVQYLVSMNKKQEANEYISLIAKLVRQNLDMATENFIQISEEIERLDLYLDIEKLRFEEKFTYKISINDNIIPESTLIPNMIIQPFAENAIIHGILPAKREGYLNITFGFTDMEIDKSVTRCLIISIADNGIGYTASSKDKQEGHTSRAINIIEELLTLLSKKLDLPNPIIISDLSERTPGTSGTEVILTLPPPLYRVVDS